MGDDLSVTHKEGTEAEVQYSSFSFMITLSPPSTKAMDLSEAAPGVTLDYECTVQCGVQSVFIKNTIIQLSMYCQGSTLTCRNILNGWLWCIQKP